MLKHNYLFCDNLISINPKEIDQFEFEKRNEITSSLRDHASLISLDYCLSQLIVHFVFWAKLFKLQKFWYFIIFYILQATRNMFYSSESQLGDFCFEYPHWREKWFYHRIFLISMWSIALILKSIVMNQDIMIERCLMTTYMQGRLFYTRTK